MSDETVTFETYWVGGKGAISRARNLTLAWEEAAHTLNYATMANAGGAEAPGQIYEHLGNLYSGTGYLPQSLEQMAAHIEQLAAGGQMYLAKPGEVSEAAASTVDALNTAAQAARALTTALQAAQSAISALGLTDAAGEAFDRSYGDPDPYATYDENED